MIEDRGDDREEAGAVFLAEVSLNDVGLHEAEDELDDRLAAAGNHLHAPGAEPEDQHDQRNNEESDQDDAVYLERRSREEEHRGKEIVEGRPVETTVARSVIGGEGKKVESVV